MDRKDFSKDFSEKDIEMVEELTQKGIGIPMTQRETVAVCNALATVINILDEPKYSKVAEEEFSIISRVPQLKQAFRDDLAAALIKLSITCGIPVKPEGN